MPRQKFLKELEAPTKTGLSESSDDESNSSDVRPPEHQRRQISSGGDNMSIDTISTDDGDETKELPHFDRHDPNSWRRRAAAYRKEGYDAIASRYEHIADDMDGIPLPFDNDVTSNNNGSCGAGDDDDNDDDESRRSNNIRLLCSHMQANDLVYILQQIATDTEDDDLFEAANSLIIDILLDSDDSDSDAGKKRPHGGSPKGRAGNKDRDFDGTAERPNHQYFSGPDSIYDEGDFERRFCMTRKQFVDEVYYTVLGKGTFAGSRDALGKRIDPLVRTVACLRYLTHGLAADLLDETYYIHGRIYSQCRSEGFC